MVYDGFLILPVIMATVAIATGVAVLAGNDSGSNYSATLPPLLVQALAIVCVVCFYSCFWRLKGQTLGMQAWRIKLYSLRGDTISYRQVGLRCLGAGLSLAAFGLGYLWSLVDRDGRCWHDYLSGTALELLPKVKRQGSSK
jgi:uncharacterized RDD family membrane protein YckC